MTLKLDIQTEQAMMDHVKNFKQSGLSQIEYCRIHKFSYSKLIYWLRKVRRMAPD